MVVFDPAIHLAYQKPTRCHTLAELGITDGISEVGITEPFPFLSAEGVRALRSEVFSKDVLDKYGMTFVASRNTMFRGRVQLCSDILVPRVLPNSRYGT